MGFLRGLQTGELAAKHDYEHYVPHARNNTRLRATVKPCCLFALRVRREKHTRGHGAGLRRAGVGQGFGEEEASATQAGTRARNSRGRLSNPLTIVLARRKIRRPTGGGPKQAV
jgi:hypothetical protein